MIEKVEIIEIRGCGATFLGLRGRLFVILIGGGAVRLKAQKPKSSIESTSCQDIC